MSARTDQRPASRTTSTGRVISSAEGMDARLTVPGTIDYQYDADGVYKASEKASPRRVLDWAPIVLERQDVIGTERGRRTVMTSRYVIQVGETIHTANMVDLHDGSIWHQFPGANGAASRTLKDVLTNIVRAQGVHAPLITELVSRSGWHTIEDGRRGYLYPNDTVFPQDFPLRLKTAPTENVIAYCRRQVEPPDRENVSAVFLDLSSELVAHAGPSLLGIAAGARALVTSVRHPRTSVLLDGPFGLGKTSAEWLAGAFVTGWGWPIVPTASFNDAAGAVETKLGAAGDIALNVDDCPNGANASNVEDARANSQLELVIRSTANGGPMRDRQDRTDPHKIRESNSIHGLPIISVEHRPRSMRGSLMRRCLIVKYDAAHCADTLWFGKHSDRVGRAVRAAGERIVGYVHSVDWEKLAEWLSERASAHYDALLPRATVAFPGWSANLNSIVLGAAEVATGVDLLCASLGIELPALADAVADELVAACAHTAQLATDEHTASDDLCLAVADLIVKSLIGGRAHIADCNGRPAPALPGFSPGEQGLKGSPERTGEWFPVGPVPLFYVPDRFAEPVLAVKSTSLHELAKLSGDPRLAGLSSLTMPGRLAETGAAMPATQKNKGGIHYVHGIGGEGKKRWVLIRSGILDQLTSDEPEDDTAGQPVAAGRVPEPGEVESWLASLAQAIAGSASPEEIDALPWSEMHAGVRAGFVTEDQASELVALERRRRRELISSTLPAPIPEPRAEPPAAPAGAEPGAVAIPAPAGPRPIGGKGRARVVSTSTPAVPSVVYVDAGGIHTAGGTLPAPGGLAELVATVAAGVGSEALVLLADPGAYGLTGKAPSVTTRWHRGFKVLTDAGWHAESVPSKKPTVGPWTNMQHPESGTVRLCVLPWLTSANPFPLSEEERSASVDVDGAELVRRMELLARLTGTSYRGTQANTAVTMLRELLARTARAVPRWQGTAPITTATAPLDLKWHAPDMAEAAAGLPLVYEFDGRRNYLQPIREVRLCLDDLSHTGPLRYDPKLSGLFKVEIPAWPWPGLPAPTSQTGIGWVTAPVLKAYVQLGMVPRILESYSGPGRQAEGTREFVRVVSEAYAATADESDRAVRDAVKGLYRTLHGKLEAASTRIGRPDWGLAIRDEAWCSVLRRIYTTAGIKDGSDVPTGPLPLRIRTDEIAYASAAETPEQAVKSLPGIRLGDQLGEFGCKRGAGIPFDQWMTQGSE